MEKEEFAIVLDFLPYGYPLEKKMMPIAQAIGTKNFTLLQLVPRKSVKLELNEKVYIGEGKRDKIYYILGKIPENKMTETANQNLQKFIDEYVSLNENKIADFFNKAEAINTRLHQLELLPGFGKKYTENIINERNKKPFESLEDIKKRIHNIPDPKKSVEKRILDEITKKEKYLLFMGDR